MVSCAFLYCGSPTLDEARWGISALNGERRRAWLQEQWRFIYKQQRANSALNSRVKTFQVTISSLSSPFLLCSRHRLPQTRIRVLLPSLALPLPQPQRCPQKTPSFPLPKEVHSQGRLVSDPTSLFPPPRQKTPSNSAKRGNLPGRGAAPGPAEPRFVVYYSH